MPEHALVEGDRPVLGAGGHGQLHMIERLHAERGTHALRRSTAPSGPTRPGAPTGPSGAWPTEVPAQRMVGGHLDQVDAHPVRVVDPRLDQSPRFEAVGSRASDGAAAAELGRRCPPSSGPAARAPHRGASGAGPSPHHLEEPAAGEEHHTPPAPSPNSRATASPSPSR